MSTLYKYPHLWCPVLTGDKYVSHRPMLFSSGVPSPMLVVYFEVLYNRLKYEHIYFAYTSAR